MLRSGFLLALVPLAGTLLAFPALAGRLPSLPPLAETQPAAPRAAASLAASGTSAEFSGSSASPGSPASAASRGALASPASLPLALPSGAVIEAATVANPPIDPGDPAWSTIPARAIAVYAQQTIRLNDARANAALDAGHAGPGQASAALAAGGGTPSVETSAAPADGRGASATGAAAAPDAGQAMPPGGEAATDTPPGAIAVKVAASAHTLAIRVEWADPAPDFPSAEETAAFGDALAIQFPARFGKGLRLPHIAMGDEKAHVRVYFNRPAGPDQGPMAPAEFVGAGFGSLTRTTRKTPGALTRMAYNVKEGRWSAVFSRPLSVPGHSLAQALVPIAFAVWDGARFERGGNKRLSAWRLVRLPAFRPDPAYVAELDREFTPPAGGSAGRGKALATAMCAGCHRFGETRMAPEGMAPDLSAIGGIATPGYLRASILRPGEVVVRGLHPNRHYDRSARPDAQRAYPHDEAFRWYVAGPGGTRQSKMPPFALAPQDVADLVAYLQTLGTQPQPLAKEAGR